jgi:2'-5' RNA ligase
VLAPEFRWTPAPNLHLTVRFVGSVDRGLMDGVADHIERLRPPRFDIELGDVGTFKRGRLARVVWLGLRSGSDAAGRLARLVDAECVAAGLEGEQRPFRAHLTLARARPRDGASLPQLPEPPRLQPWRASHLVLFASHPSPKGSVYEPLRTLALE